MWSLVCLLISVNVSSTIAILKGIPLEKSKEVHMLSTTTQNLFSTSIESTPQLTSWESSSSLTTKVSSSTLSSHFDRTEISEQRLSTDASLGMDDSAMNGGVNPLFVSDTFGLGPRLLSGSLRADIFNISLFDRTTVISGNGNVDFGQGFRDWIDLSSISFSQITLELASAVSGMVFNPGNGNRVFDSMTLSGGQKILFEGIEGIQFAEGYVDLTANTLPNDPLFNQQWNLHMMGVHTAWRFTTGSTNVMIGVGDTGLSVNSNGFIHTDLGNTIWLGQQSIDDTNNNHGMSVQGIISATTNNGIGMSGINWNSQTFNIDVLGGQSTDLSVGEAAQTMINQARSQGQRLVINLSLGVPESFGFNSDAVFEQVVRNNPDVLFVIAAGNDGNLGWEGLASPAFLARSYSNVMAVGASWGTQDWYGRSTTPGDRIEYSDWWGSQYGEGLTLMGPSEVIAPTLMTTDFGQSFFDYSSNFNGTSAAAPNVTGVASLVWSANPNLSAAQVSQIVSQTAVDLGSVGYDKFTGAGFVNADAAVRRSLAMSWGFA
jgi:serine protease